MRGLESVARRFIAVQQNLRCPMNRETTVGRAATRAALTTGDPESVSISSHAIVLRSHSEACDKLALMLTFQGSEDLFNHKGADMKNFSILRKYPFWMLGLLLLCSCDLVQEFILSEPPSSAADPGSIHVALIYPDDCIGDSGYCDALHFGVKRAEAELGIHLSEIIGSGE